MEIVTGEPAPTVDRDEAARLLREMAAVVRTVFGVAAPARAFVTTPTPSPVVAVPVAVPPIAPTPAAAATPPPVAALPVPAIALPVPPDPEERPSLALLQEIAFLDE